MSVGEGDIRTVCGEADADLLGRHGYAARNGFHVHHNARPNDTAVALDDVEGKSEIPPANVVHFCKAGNVDIVDGYRLVEPFGCPHGALSQSGIVFALRGDCHAKRNGIATHNYDGLAITGPHGFEIVNASNHSLRTSSRAASKPAGSPSPTCPPAGSPSHSPRTSSLAADKAGDTPPPVSSAALQSPATLAGDDGHPSIPSSDALAAGQGDKPGKDAKSEQAVTPFTNPRCQKPETCHLIHSREECFDCTMAWAKRPKDEQVRLWAEAVEAARAAA